MRPWAIALIGGAALGGLALLWSELRAPASAPRAAIGASDTSAAPDQAHSAELERPADAHGPDVHDGGAPPAQARAPQRLELLVVDRDTGLAIEGATLGVVPVDVDDSAGVPRFGGVRQDFDALVRAHGLTGVSDREGRAVLDVAASRIVVEARDERRWGRIELDHVPRRVVRLELAEQHALDVRVTEAPGAPVRGVRVQLGVVHPRRSWTVRDCVRTDASGRARFLHVDRSLAHEDHLAVRLVLVTAGRVEAFVDTETLAPIALELPACGAVEIDVRDPEGLPVADARAVLSFPHRNAAPGESIAPDTFENGRARWSFVEPGEGLFLAVWSDGHGEVQADIEGPAGPGQTFRREVVLHPMTMIVGRMVGPDGRALADTRFRAIAGGAIAGSPYVHEQSRREFTTDAAGRFPYGSSLDWDAFARADPGGAVYLYRELGCGDRPPLGARVTSAQQKELLVAAWGAAEPRRDPPAADIRLAPVACVVTGRVVDEDGVPLPDVRLRCRAVAEPGAAVPFAAEATSDELGCFWIEGELPGGSVRVSAERTGCLRLDGQLFPAGTSGVELVLRATATLAGRYLLAPGIPVDQLAVAVRPRGHAAAQPASEVLARMDPDGRWKLDGLAPGRCDVILRVRTCSLAPHSVEDVLLESGRVTRDPRLDGVDVRAVVVPCPLEVVDAEGGAPLEGTAVFYGPDGATQCTYPIRQGRARAMLFQPPLILDVFVPGYRPCVLQAVDGGRRVELRRGLQVRLSIAPGVTLPSHPQQLQCELEPELDVEQAPNQVTREILERRLAAVDDISMSFDPTSARGVDVRVPYPGRFRVRFRVQDVEVGKEVPVDTGPGSVIVVTDGGGLQRFELLPEAEALRAACERLQALPR